MENPLNQQPPQLQNQCAMDSESDDQAAQDLFDQISLSQQQVQPDPESALKNPFNDEQPRTPSAKKNKKTFKTKESIAKAKEKKRLKKEKKKEKRKLIKSKKQRKKLKRLQKSSAKKDSDGGEWSQSDGESSDQLSDCSSDSLLANLNPRKKKHLNNNASAKKKKAAENKQGFLLKQLGNDAEVSCNDNLQEDDDSSYNSKKKKKVKKEKKQVAKNLDLLKEMLEIGLCVEEEEQKSGEKVEKQYDHGIDQLYNMRGSKKKGLKITNRMFQDMEVDDFQENPEPLPTDLQLEVQPRVYSGPSSKTSSFLGKAQRLKKVRGMDSDIKNEEYDRMISDKARESISRLISQKSFEDAEEIELQVKVPEIARGRSSGQLNNSMYLRRFGSVEGIKTSMSELTRTKTQVDIRKKTKISREDFFRQITVEVKDRKSRDITHDLIKNSFKITQLEEIEQMRRKNQEKRRREALRGSDDQEELELDEENIVPHEDQEEIILNNRLGFMDKKIDEEDEQGSQKFQVDGEPLQKQMKIQLEKQQIQKNDIPLVLGDQEYRELLQKEEGVSQNQQGSEANQSDDSQSDVSEKNKYHDSVAGRQESNQDGEGAQKAKCEIQEQKECIQDKMDLQINDPIEKFEEENQEESESQSGSEISEVNPEPKQIAEPLNLEQLNRQKQQMEELEAEGINLRRNVRTITREETANQISSIVNENKGEQGKLKEDEARKEFRKLRKIASMLKERRKNEKKFKMAGEFFEEEAQEGSDNEEHDHEVKKINYQSEEKEYEGIDLDADLEELIDNAVDVDEENEELAFQKYMEDVKIQDREELKRIMRGDFKRRNDHEAILEQIEEDQRDRQKRMDDFEEYMKKREIEEGKEMYVEEAEGSESGKQPKDKEGDLEVFDEMNEQNLKKYLDDSLADTKKYSQISIKPARELPESVKRTKNLQKRNTMKAKQRNEEDPPNKLKRTSSCLNEIFMKNKQKPKPITFIRNFGIATKR